MNLDGEADDVMHISAVQRKLSEWGKASSASPEFSSVNAGVDLTVHPSVVRATFPGLTPFSVLYSKDISRLLVRIPSVTITSVVSFLFGVAWALIVLRQRRTAPRALADIAKQCQSSGGTGAALVVQRPLRILPRLTSRAFLRLAVTCAVSALFIRFVRQRQPAVAAVSKFINFSEHPGGPCHVVNKVLSLSNSHAGTHADTPQHFTDNMVSSFHNAHYTGRAVIVDLSPYLYPVEAPAGSTRRGITVEILRRALQPILPLAAAERRGGASSTATNASTTSVSAVAAALGVWRLLFVTRRMLKRRSGGSDVTGGVGVDDDNVWDSNFAFFEPEAARFLTLHFPNLLLVGVDTPSVDHHSASPICHHSHGDFYRAGVAIVENLQFRGLYCMLEEVPLIHGSMLTVFSPTQSFDDSRGCSVLFFPADL